MPYSYGFWREYEDEEANKQQTGTLFILES